MVVPLFEPLFDFFPLTYRRNFLPSNPRIRFYSLSLCRRDLP